MSRSAIVAGVLTGCILAVACHRPPAVALGVADKPLLERQFCWWAVLRTSRAPVSVAARFRQAYAEMKLGRISSGELGDTTWAHAGPTTVIGQSTYGAYESGVMAYTRGDSTHFRYFISISAPPGGWTHPGDSLQASMGDIDFCADVARHASIGWTQPARPTGEESLSLWYATPWVGVSRDSVAPH